MTARKTMLCISAVGRWSASGGGERWGFDALLDKHQFLFEASYIDIWSLVMKLLEMILLLRWSSFLRWASHDGGCRSRL